jgi:hypothetical protein
VAAVESAAAAESFRKSFRVMAFIRIMRMTPAKQAG